MFVLSYHLLRCRRTDRVYSPRTTPQYKDECEGGHSWHKIKKMSMENGDNHGVVYENVAWQYQRWGAEHGVYPSGFKPGLASFATLTFKITEPDGKVTVEDQGVYNHVEQGKEGVRR